jgi:hypothetical protein
MFEAPTAFAVSVTLMALALTCLGLAASLIHLRRRHRQMRATLTRVRQERDIANWSKTARG